MPNKNWDLTKVNYNKSKKSKHTFIANNSVKYWYNADQLEGITTIPYLGGVHTYSQNLDREEIEDTVTE